MELGEYTGALDATAQSHAHLADARLSLCLFFRLAGLVAGYLLQTLEFYSEDGSLLKFDVELYEKVRIRLHAVPITCDFFDAYVLLPRVLSTTRTRCWGWTARQYQYKLMLGHSA